MSKVCVAKVIFDASGRADQNSAHQIAEQPFKDHSYDDQAGIAGENDLRTGFPEDLHNPAIERVGLGLKVHFDKFNSIAQDPWRHQLKSGRQNNTDKPESDRESISFDKRGEKTVIWTILLFHGRMDRVWVD